MAGVTKRVIGGFLVDFLKGGDIVVDRDVKRIGVEIGHDAEGSGVWEMAQYGFRRLMQDLRDSGLNFELDYETKDYD